MWRVGRHALILLLGALILLSLSPIVEGRKHADDDDSAELGFSSAPGASSAQSSAGSEDSEAQVIAVRRLPKEDIFLQAEKYRNERDLRSALPLYEEAAQAGNDEALLVLGQLYEVRCFWTL